MTHSEPHIHLLDLLDGLVFPATKPEIIVHAEQRGASEEALDRLQGIPEDEFNTRQELLDNLDTIEQQPGNENLWGSADSEDLLVSEEDAPEAGQQEIL